jgi:hypothetical protein
MATPRVIKSRGDLSLGLVVPPGQRDRMAVILRFSTLGGPVQIELTRDDVARLAADLGVLLGAEIDQVARWWYRLSRDDRRPGALPTAELRHSG